MIPSSFETTHFVFCPRCKKKTKFTALFYYKQYICSECGLEFKREEYSKVLKEYSKK